MGGLEGRARLEEASADSLPAVNLVCDGDAVQFMWQVKGDQLVFYSREQATQKGVDESYVVPPTVRG